MLYNLYFNFSHLHHFTLFVDGFSSLHCINFNKDGRVHYNDADAEGSTTFLEEKKSPQI